MNKMKFEQDMAKRTVISGVTVLLLGGTGSVHAFAANVSSNNIVTQQNSVENDKADSHITLIVSMVWEFSEDYSVFTPKDHLNRTRLKQLWDELDRSQMFDIVDYYPDIFDKYNDLYRQEKLSGFLM